MEKIWDVVVLGGGPAGVMSALKLAMSGKKVCMVEQGPQRLGGTCLHEGCMATKSMLKTAEVYQSIKHAQEYGIEATAAPLDLHCTVMRKNEHLKALNSRLQQMAVQTGLHIQSGHGSFLSPTRIAVDGPEGHVELEAEKIVITTGSRPRELDCVPIDGVQILNSNQLLQQTHLPERLLIIGGGAIGCEFASMFQAFGSDVTLVECAEHLLPHEDRDTGETLQCGLEQRGIRVLTEKTVAGVNKTDAGVELFLQGNTQPLVADQVLVAVGRKPNTDWLNLAAAEINCDGEFIVVNDQLQTSQSHIYAAGDVINTMMLAHSAMQESDILVTNLLGHEKKLNINTIPRVVYSFPQVAAVGLTEQELQESSYRALFQPFSESAKALVDQRQEGHIKLLVDNDNDTICGATIVGDHATELIHELALAISQDLQLGVLKDVVHAHPTLAESIWDLARHQG
nr:dihydrolipoyl dehydrogenase [uncultured Desulfuromonas sp.]